MFQPTTSSHRQEWLQTQVSTSLAKVLYIKTLQVHAILMDNSCQLITYELHILIIIPQSSKSSAY